MTLLKMGVACAVVDAKQALLLSQRGDLGMWNLPSGRLDVGELLVPAAQREVREETGLEVIIVRPIGLYYYAAWQRLNVLFLAHPNGGVLQQTSPETRANGFFALNALPQPLLDTVLVRDVFAPEPRLQIIETPPEQVRQMRRRFAWRWVKNLLTGRPEPRYPRFTIHASLAIRNQRNEVLALVDEQQGHVLPGLECGGELAPWEQVRRYVRDTYDLYELRHTMPRWMGLYQDPSQNRIEFVFTAYITSTSPLTFKNLDWIPIGSRTWWQGYQPYINHLVSENADAILMTTS
jgi:ADP-ribose pyrophosphatase YjhB (NUDIX family)